MRIIFSVVAVMGLLLVGLSAIEIRSAREYRDKVSDVQQFLAKLDAKNVGQAKQMGAVFTGPSIAWEYGAPLDGVDALERGWLVVTSAGAIIFLAGVAGVIIARRPHV